MLKLSNKIAYIIIGILLALVIPVIAANVSVPQATQKGDFVAGLTTGNYQLLHPCTNGKILAASSTATTGWACVDNTASLGATTTITSNILINGPTFTFASGTPATGIDTFITGSGSTITWTNALQAGYNIPLSASTTNWNNFYNTPSTRITAGTNLSWSGNTLNGYYATSTLIAGGTATGPAITIATSSDTNLGLQAVCAGSTCTFTPQWIGTLADGRIASASNWNTAFTQTERWNGGATDLVAATGRTSLGLGSMALLANTGSTTITTLGTVSSGTWQAGVVQPSYGGTGTSTAPTQTGMLLAADGTGTIYGPTKLVNGANITITTSTPGQITIAASGSTGITSISALTGPAIAVATTSDTNILLSINTSTANTLTFVPGWTGSLAVGRGGMGTTTWITGSIPFYNGTNFTENNSQLFWDNTNKRLGVGTSTPDTSLDVVSQVGQEDPLHVELLGSGQSHAAAFLNNNATSGGVHISFNNASTSFATSTGLDIGLNANGNAVIKTLSAFPINISTNNTLRGTFDSVGNFNLATLTPNSLVWADSGKNLGAALLTNSATLTWSTGTPTSLSAAVVKVPNAVTFNSSGSGGASPQSFDGSGAITVSYNTIGAQVAGTYFTTAASTSTGSIFNLTSSGATVTLTIPTTPTFTGINLTNATTSTLNLSGASASTLIVTDANKNLISYTAPSNCSSGQAVYGLTAAGSITCGANGLQAALTNPDTGTGANGQVAYWTGTTALSGSSKLLFDGSVFGFNATSSTIGFNIQGTAGTNDVLNVASSSTGTILRVTSTSRIGIGTSTPDQLLSVYGNMSVATGTNPALFVNTATTQVGIGTTSLSSNFTVVDNSSTTKPSVMLIGGGSKLGCIGLYDTGASGYVYMKYVSGQLNTSTSATICQ